jgi:arylsulfatase A-like enzyme
MEGYRRLGVLKDTIFVFVGDHGQMFDEHGAKQIHNAIYQEGLHVPALIYAPGTALVARRVRGPRQQIDILPTIAELLGLQIRGAELPGQSLLHAVDPERELFYTSSIDWSFLSARHGHRKYIYSFDREPVEVFDLDKDPKELAALRDVDVEELARMKQRMLEWRMNAEASMLARPSDDLDPSAAWLPR